MIEHKKNFGIYHWDTFDNVTLLIDEANTFKEAKSKLVDKYKDRMASNGADKVEIVDKKGIIVFCSWVK